MEMFGRVGLVEIPVLIAPDQKVWMDKMIKEGKIAVPPGGTLEKGSLYSACSCTTRWRSRRGRRRSKQTTRTTSRKPLKTAVGVVLAAFRPSTYAKKYASGLHLLRPSRADVLNGFQNTGY